MTDLREIVDVRGPGLPSEFVCEATVGSDVLAASGLPEGEILRRAAEAVEFELGMAEIHTGTAAGVDHAVFPATRGHPGEGAARPQPVAKRGRAAGMTAATPGRGASPFGGAPALSVEGAPAQRRNESWECSDANT